MFAHGVDFGRYTLWERPATSAKPIDFVIAGLTSGDRVTDKGSQNFPVIALEEIRMIYHFYEFKINWVPQVDKFLEVADAADAHYLWWDFEGTMIPYKGNYRGSRQNQQRVALETYEALSKLKENWDGRAGIYCNFNDYNNYLKPYIGQFLRTVDLWIAFPNNKYYDPKPGWLPDKYWIPTGRPEGDWKFHQYTWGGNSKDYGVVNHLAKKGIDLNICNYTVGEMKAWLGIDSQPEPPLPAPNGWNEAIDEYKNKIIELGEDLKK